MRIPFQFLLIVGIVPLISFTPVDNSDEVFIGRLEVKGPCAQRVVSVISKNAHRAKVEGSWKDPITEEVHQYVFSVRNFCDLKSFKEGDIFSFKFNKNKLNPCPTCLMYRPIPGVDRSIVIVETKMELIEQ